MPPGVHFRIAPADVGVVHQLRELWVYRELLYFLVWRDLKVRYKQTMIGAAWAVVQPLLTMAAFSLFFGYLAGIASDGVPYPLFAYAALLPWQLFAFAVTESANSLVVQRPLVTKVYFPRLLVPLSAILTGLADFAIAFVVFLPFLYYFRDQVTLGAALLWLPCFLLMAVATSLAVGLWLAALNVRYRDVRYTIPFLCQFWLFMTPVAYSASLVPANWRWVYGLNPMAGVVQGFRWALLGGPAVEATIGTSAVMVVVLLIGGLRYFRSVERTLADVV